MGSGGGGNGEEIDILLKIHVVNTWAAAKTSPTHLIAARALLQLQMS